MLNSAEQLTALFESAYRVTDLSRSGDTTIHVSNLIDFCPRAYYLCKTHDFAYHQVRYPSIAEGWTWDLGYAVQEIQITRLMTTPEHPVFGAWACRHCGHLEYGRQLERHKCSKCKCRAWEPKDLRLRVPIKVKGKVIITVTASIDYGVLLGNQTKVTVVDSKSLKAEDFDHLTNAKLDHRKQVQQYMYWGTHKDRVFEGEARPGAEPVVIDPGSALVAYGVKGYRAMPFKVYTVEQDTEFVTNTDRALQQLAKHLVAGTEPTKICDSPSKLMAKSCVAAALCFGHPLWKGRK